MTERELNIALREMARDAGLCERWYSDWSDDDTLDECFDRFVRGHDFCVEKDWPSLEFSRRSFDKEDLHRHNIYLDDDVDIENAENGYYVFLGDSKVTLHVTGFKAVTVYCRHDSKVDVEASDGARVFVFYYDRSTGNCRSDEYSNIKMINRNRK